MSATDREYQPQLTFSIISFHYLYLINQTLAEVAAIVRIQVINELSVQETTELNARNKGNKNVVFLINAPSGPLFPPAIHTFARRPDNDSLR